MDERQQLQAFYQTIKERAPTDLRRFPRLYGPDLIWIDDEYLQASPRIAIIGQQILGWSYTYTQFVSSWTVSDAVAEHREFDFGVDYYQSPFWQFFHQVRQAAFPQEPEARRRVLWANLVKFVCVDGTPVLKKRFAGKIIELQEDILKTELRIAAPDICIFVTGPNYDWIIERYFPDVRFERLGLRKRVLSKLEHPDLPEGSYRTYHPNALRRLRLWDTVFRCLRRELGWSSKSTG